MDASLPSNSQEGPPTVLDLYSQPITLHGKERAENTPLSGKAGYYATELRNHQALLHPLESLYRILSLTEIQQLHGHLSIHHLVCQGKPYQFFGQTKTT